MARVLFKTEGLFGGIDARSFVARIPPDPLVLVHVNADPDAVGSAFALARAWGGRVAAPGGVSASGRRLAEAVGCAFVEAPPESAALRVLVDASSASQFRPWEARLAPYALVDHHAPGDLAEGAVAAIVRPRTSCAEVAFALLEESGAPPDPTAAFALLAALVADTGRFRFADRATLEAAVRLMDLSGRSLDDVADVLGQDEEEDTVSGRMAALKSAQRCEVAQVAGFLVATSVIGSHEARAALGLVRCGADVAFVAAERPEGTRVSGRAGREVAARVHLGDLFREVAKGLGVSGGGHAASAGLNGKVEPRKALDALAGALAANLR